MKFHPICALLLAAVIPALAQSPLETANASLDSPAPDSVFSETSPSSDEIPSLFEEENEDLGPQYLLVPGSPAHKWFQALADFQILHSSNPTLDDSATREASDLAVATAQFLAQTPNKQFLGGSINASLGVRYQLFRYGTLEDTEIAGQPVDRNNFEGYSFFSNLDWQKNNWQANFGLRWTELNSDSQGNRFFEELVPTWELSRNFFIGQNTRIQLKYDGAYYITDSEAFIPQFADLNDRLANSLSISLLHRLNQQLYLEPSLRYTYANYQGSTNNDREDTTLRLGTSLSYLLHPNIQIRLFTGYQKRNSNGIGIVDYENWDLGLGTTLSMRF